MQRTWDNYTKGFDDKLFLNYFWGFRQFSSSIEYVRVDSKANIIDNTLWVKLSRKFYGKFRGRKR